MKVAAYMARCTIEWNSLSLAAWEARFAKIRRSNLLQSYDYAQAVCPLRQQRARWGIIYIDGAEAGMVQILEAGLFKHALHFMQLDRGPLWFDGFGRLEDYDAFFAVLTAQFPARFFCGRRILPECADHQDIRIMLARHNCRRLNRPGYQTIWLDLQADEQTRRASLKKNWRNKLTAAEKAGFEMIWDDSGVALPLLIAHYQADKQARGYGGAPVALLKALTSRFAQSGKLLTGTAILDGQPAAQVLFLLHGSSATYQAGWTSEAGKKHGAHNILLWRGCRELAARKIADLDLGGVNEKSAAGVKAFKDGMGGTLVQYAGHYK